jgi:hypothetical protein
MESGRVLAGALEVGGVRIPDGGTVIVLLASANGRPETCGRLPAEEGGPAADEATCDRKYHVERR